MSTRLFNYYGQDRFVRPRADVHGRLLAEAQDFVLAKFQPGTLSKKEDVSGILRAFFEFFSMRMDSLLRKVGSREFMEFVLHQYDVAAKEWRRSPDEVSAEACGQGFEFIIARRGLKYIAERTAMRSSLPEFAPAGPQSLFQYAEEVIAAGFMLSFLYMASDKVYYLFPGEMEMELHRPNRANGSQAKEMPFSLRYTNANNNAELTFSARTVKDRNNRDKYFPNRSMNFDFQRQGKILDASFEKSFGCGYGKFLLVLASINEQAQ